MEYTKGEQILRDKIRDKVYYNGVGAMSVTYADAIMEIPEIKTLPAMYEALGEICRRYDEDGILDISPARLALAQARRE